MSDSLRKDDYKNQLEKTGVIAFVPGGNSMWPTLKNRKQSVIVRKKEEKLKKWDVALYLRPNGSNVLHRVLEPTEFGYIICGDSQFVREKVNEEQVYGVMTGFYRGKKYIDVNDERYKKEVEKLFSDEKKRKRRVKRFFFFSGLITLPKRAVRKMFRLLTGKKPVERTENAVNDEKGESR